MIHATQSRKKLDVDQWCLWLLFFGVLTLQSGTGNALAMAGQQPGQVVSSSAISPYAIDVDLRDLPLASPWQPGDPFIEIPRIANQTAVGIYQLPPFDMDPLIEYGFREPLPLSDSRALASPRLNFDGHVFTVNPPDTVGDVGKNYYIQAVNHSSGTAYTFYNKTDGGTAAGPFILSSLCTADTGGCATTPCASGYGDPIVLYDSHADRWLLSEFSNMSDNMCVYISKTSDPLSGGWYNYQFVAPNFPDYPKYGVWPDAYYVSTNESSPAVYAFQRSAMLAGTAAISQRFTAAPLAGFGFNALIPCDLDGPAPPSGSPNYFMRHRDDEMHNPGSSDPTKDFLEIYEFHVDWTTPANSTFTGPINIEVAEFDSNLCPSNPFECFEQPGTSPRLDPIREVIMHRLQYRNFGAYEVLVGNFVVDVGSDQGGIRWFELRKSGAGGWTLHQEGTYAGPNGVPDSTTRWMGGIAMDGAGNIALGYNVVNDTDVFPGIRYAGRHADDPLGTLPRGEHTLIAGTAANGSTRYGDYSAMSVDPVNECEFWFTGEYNVASTWSTRIGAFQFDNCAEAYFYVDDDNDCGSNSPCYQTILAAIAAVQPNTKTRIFIAEGPYPESSAVTVEAHVILDLGWNTDFTGLGTNPVELR
jgi:hypothetical protein